MAGPGQDGRNLDPGIRLVLEELRDLRLEMRADRQHANEERRQADEAWREERQQADKAWQEEKRQADEARRLERLRADEELRQDRLRSDERFQEIMREFREDSARREAVTQEAFRDIHTVGLSIVKTLNRHTRILERIDRKLGNGRQGRDNGRGD